MHLRGACVPEICEPPRAVRPSPAGRHPSPRTAQPGARRGQRLRPGWSRGSDSVHPVPRSRDGSGAGQRPRQAAPEIVHVPDAGPGCGSRTPDGSPSQLSSEPGRDGRRAVHDVWQVGPPAALFMVPVPESTPCMRTAYKWYLLALSRAVRALKASNPRPGRQQHGGTKKPTRNCGSGGRTAGGGTSGGMRWR